MHELRYPDDYAVAAEQRRRAGVQRVRPLLQTSRRQQAADDEKGRYPDEKEETEEATVVVVVVVVQRSIQRGQRPTASAASATAAASALVRGHRPIGYYFRSFAFLILPILLRYKRTILLFYIRRNYFLCIF